MIFDLNGTQLSTVFDVDGQTLTQAYDINGEILIEPMTADIVVMTYNVLSFNGLNANETMQESIINTYNADIIGFQEVEPPMPSVGSEVLADYPYFEFGIDYTGLGMASKLTLNDIAGGYYSLKANQRRGYQKAYITVKGKNICWINTHLETSTNEGIKVSQAEELFDLTQNEEYFIITGDLNTTCKSTSDTEYTTIMAQFINAGYHCANCSEQHGFLDTWTYGQPDGTWYPCDHVITSANISIDNVIVDTTKIDYAVRLSQNIDHLPLIAYLTVN